MIDWSYLSIGLRGFHRWTDSERWFPSVGWSSRMDFAHEQIEDTDHQRFSQQVQLGQEFIGANWEWSSRVNTHWLTTTGYRCVCAQNLFVASHHRTRPRVGVYDSWIQTPDFSEIYGNRGAIIGKSKSASRNRHHSRHRLDSPATLHWLNHMQLALFARDTKDEIIFIQNAQRESIPMNFERTRMLGVESDWTVAFQSWSWTGSVTFNHSENRSSDDSLFGNTLPNVPRWMSGQQLWWMGDQFWLGTDVYWSDGNYWDAPNQRKAPTRLIHNATLRWSPPNCQLELTGRNLWNRIVVDAPIDP